MIEKDIEIRLTDGTSDGVLFRPEGERRWPGVIFLTDIGGIRPATRDMARRLAAEGYCVLLPNVFYRSGRPPLWDFPRRLGEERTMKRIAELSAPVTPEAMECDAMRTGSQPDSRPCTRAPPKASPAPKPHTTSTGCGATTER